LPGLREEQHAYSGDQRQHPGHTLFQLDDLERRAQITNNGRIQACKNLTLANFEDVVGELNRGMPAAGHSGKTGVGRVVRKDSALTRHRLGRSAGFHDAGVLEAVKSVAAN